LARTNDGNRRLTGERILDITLGKARDHPCICNMPR
jgi:hypothetical protein